MLFIGDIAVPEKCSTKLEGVSDVFADDIVANLEGCIFKGEKAKDYSIYNSCEVIHILKKFGVKAVTLANNHILDEQDYFGQTKKLLSDNAIKFFGAGQNKEEAHKYVKIISEGHAYYLLGYAWSITGVKNRNNGVQISLLKRKDVLYDIKTIKEMDNDARIVCLFHWGYELELYPLPMHRELAREVIDAGAYAVIGCHAHCIQGVELYNDRPIVYGLGNFFFPEGTFFGGKLSYPEIAHTELAFQMRGDEFACHLFYYDTEKDVIRYLKTVQVDSSEMRERTPYYNMSSTEYAIWFRKNRRKKKFLPIFYSSSHVFRNQLKTMWCILRALLIRCLLRVGIKGGPV